MFEECPDHTLCWYLSKWATLRHVYLHWNCANWFDFTWFCSWHEALRTPKASRWLLHLCLKYVELLKLTCLLQLSKGDQECSGRQRRYDGSHTYHIITWRRSPSCAARTKRSAPHCMCGYLSYNLFPLMDSECPRTLSLDNAPLSTVVRR